MSDSPLPGTPVPAADDANPPAIASFAPHSSSPNARRSYQVHRKSPLLVATPPQVTRALSQSYWWLRHANYVAGLLTWTTDDPWESFLVVAVFWLFALYGDFLLRWGGNVLAVAVITVGMFLRRYHEPTSTTLDEILETLNTLTLRVGIFFSPCLTLTAYLSSPLTATSATTRPALTNLFIRIFLTTPAWLALSVYPFQLLTPRRIVVAVGTLVLSYHSRPAKVTRTLLWRSQTVRYAAEQLTGLRLMPEPPPPALPPRKLATQNTQDADAQETVSSPLTASMANASPGVKFTFAIYENQRRWIGVGWTNSLFAYERAPWTDEHLQPCPEPHEFCLPATPPGSGVVWRWVPGEDWAVDGAATTGKEGSDHHKKQDVKDRLGGSGVEGEGWWYYDNKWRDGRRGVDGWGRYTRRRKWTRRAELVEESAPPLPSRPHSHADDASKPGIKVVDEKGREKVLDEATAPSPTGTSSADHKFASEDEGDIDVESEEGGSEGGNSRRSSHSAASGSGSGSGLSPSSRPSPSPERTPPPLPPRTPAK